MPTFRETVRARLAAFERQYEQARARQNAPRQAVPAAPKPPADKLDLINKPPHYILGGIEVIDAIEAWGLGFRLGNVVKYVARADHKGSTVADLKKARWYLDREIAARAAGK